MRSWPCVAGKSRIRKYAMVIAIHSLLQDSFLIGVKVNHFANPYLRRFTESRFLSPPSSPDSDEDDAPTTLSAAIKSST